MADFRRAFAVTISVIVLVLTAVLAFELINTVVVKSGFSSGEVLVLEYEKGVFFGEVMGEKFLVDASPVLNTLPLLENLTLLLPPYFQLLMRFFVFVF